ncbi:MULTISPECIES: hypothetical protein [Methylobacteriaceae]|uniref:hypothetical protein n=1 Tax=Methylobacteriaceae TaxID=119045 RepID=UPI000DAAD984|nr:MULTISPECIES: hypothetical protein [Methylobacterium]AWV19807.1 hypothetical protein A3862_29635 [Methylobacterium sp. XJLW]AYO86373.1 hypothetical protein EBB05_28695 [Methylobacterium brachiatum]
MTGTIIPLRSRGDAASALASFDGIAAEMLTDGRAVSLSAARIEVILAKLRTQRTEMAALLADLQARPPSGDIQLDTINADLSVAVSKGLAQIELFIQQAKTYAERARGSELPI